MRRATVTKGDNNISIAATGSNGEDLKLDVESTFDDAADAAKPAKCVIVVKDPVQSAGEWKVEGSITIKSDDEDDFNRAYDRTINECEGWFDEVKEVK